MTDEALGSRLASRLTSVLGFCVSVGDLTRLTGGASRETWSFAASSGGSSGQASCGASLSGGTSSSGASSRRLVLRRDPPGTSRVLGRSGMGLEALALAAAARAGVAVPPLVDACSDSSVLGAEYLITDFVDGETIARRLLRDPRYASARVGMAFELGRTLARIHAIPVSSVPGLLRLDPLPALYASLDEAGEPLPAVEVGLRWLSDHRLSPVPETLVHGDFRTGNLIISEDGLRAVLDWELVHRGDPREDLGWLCVKCWRFGSALPAGGFGTVAELLDGYASVAGWRPSEEAVRWWQIYRTCWWAIGCRAMAGRHLSGEMQSVELAAIGRRVCEQEHDLLLLLGLPAGAPSLVAGPVSDLQGRPSSADLASAVASFLRSEVMPATSERVAFLARVAANMLDMVAREVSFGAELESRHRSRLAALGVASQAELAAAIRSGRLDASDPVLLDAIRADVTGRLAVANPRYFALPG